MQNEHEIHETHNVYIEIHNHITYRRNNEYFAESATIRAVELEMINNSFLTKSEKWIFVSKLSIEECPRKKSN